MNTVDLSYHILNCLYGKTGRRNAKTGAELSSKLLGCNSSKNRRSIQRTIEYLRNCGHEICSSDHSDGKMGYFIPDTRGEAEVYFRSAKNRATKTLVMLKRVARSIDQRFSTQYEMSLK